MCGIAGWYRRDGQAVPAAVIQAQCATIVHRGPDDEGVLTDGDLGIGMRRLSIIDLAGGHQPIETRDRRLAIVFNGEIYNHRELRQELVAAGHAFTTQSDTETILLAFRQWGDAAWSRLEGMFAVAIWDRQARSLTLARDPIGIKPLYVTGQNGGLAFASELPALEVLPGHRFDVSPRAVHDFFSFGHVRMPRSIYQQVHSVKPGHVLRIGPSGPPVETAFWRATYHRAEVRTEAEWVEDFRIRWLDTVRQHLLSDVEVGAFLSGGIDSSAVVAAMRRVSDAPVRTFTIGFPIERYNEAPAAEAVAQHLGCLHTTRTIDLKRARDILPAVQRCYGEPFADPSAVPTWYVSQVAREQVKVVLSGDGGDELFMGYKRHRTEQTVGSMNPLARRLARSVASWPSTPLRPVNYVLHRVQKALSSAGLPDGVSRFFARTQITSPEMRSRLYDPAFHSLVEGAHPFEALRDEYFPDPAASISPDPLEQFVYADLALNLPSAMLTKVDRASMAHSLEVRVPMLGARFVDWAMGVPTSMKMRGTTGKYLLRKAIGPWLPEGATRRRKQGFAIPLAEWFAGDFGNFALELWKDSGLRDAGFLSPAAVDAVFAAHSAGKRDHGRLLYALSVFCLWWDDRRP
ncbi:MAG: asparagine synthase (glutamine-hydrolyzing) [Pseudomonadota bacterium]|nr:asparagine synthase (glutamine-hydrolyzing) [Pseudomonadota bacterium]